MDNLAIEYCTDLVASSVEEQHGKVLRAIQDQLERLRMDNPVHFQHLVDQAEGLDTGEVVELVKDQLDSHIWAWVEACMGRLKEGG